MLVRVFVTVIQRGFFVLGQTTGTQRQGQAYTGTGAKILQSSDGIARDKKRELTNTRLRKPVLDPHLLQGGNRAFSERLTVQFNIYARQARVHTHALPPPYN